MLRAAKRRSEWARVTSALLGTLLAVGVPGPAPNAFASEPAAPEPSAAALSVASDPQGATVYVNGELRGQTPVTLDGVTPGEHRVRLVKEGYLDNSRVVSVRSGQPGTVQVKMTRTDSQALHTVQQDPGSGGGGGGGKKALWIGLGVAAVGAGAYFLLRETNEAPTAGSITHSPNAGLAGATAISFSSGASDPDGDPLTFSWNFGDGGTGSGQPATHTYEQAGTFNVSLTVSDGKKSATGSDSVTIRNLTARWSGSITGGGVLQTVANLTQSGANLSGTMTFPGSGLPAGNVTGRVTSPLNVTFTVSVPSFQPFTFNGTVDEAATRLTGTATGSGFTGQPWTLTRQ